MKSLLTLGIAAVMLTAAPAFAGHGHDKWDKHAEKHWKKEHRHWAKHHSRYYVEERVVYAPPAVVERRVVTRIEERPVYVAPAPVPAPGIHVVMPNVYVPF
jgi:hypothetical protein